ncbi:hypothetical protein F5Y15DRAFT_159178 [Xylariaceae sp. FL0016]|nr:hypothetical protein F5Y15DRAFT_159178 [Xylariaceae sp. FL0016]
MSPKLKELRLPLLVEERRRMEEAAAQSETVESVYNADSSSSDATSPVTPTFSMRGHLRYSSSMSSFELTLPATSDESPASPASPKQSTIHTPPSKRILDDVEEEPFEYDGFGYDVINVDDDDEDIPEHYGLYDCLCVEPCLHRDADLAQSTPSFYTSSRDVDYDLGCLSDSDFSFTLRSAKSRRRDGSEPPFGGFSHRIGSHFSSISNRWRASKKSSAFNSPISDLGTFERRPTTSHAASSRSSSLSARGRFRPDRTNEPPMPPTPALSFRGSSDSITLPALDIEKAQGALVDLERERAQATTPLLPPMMAFSSSEQLAAQPSPLESPTIVSSLPAEPQSPLILSPPLSTKPSVSSFRAIVPVVDLPPIPAPDAWSDRLGHANFTILPLPYKPEELNLTALYQLRADWDAARVNYTKHLVRTGEHYGTTSKTYTYTEAKWNEIQETWRSFHDEVAEAIVATGESSLCEKFDECVLTSVPIMDAEGKFPERGDEDIVGPMVREATMSCIGGTERKRPGFWRNLTERVSLRK